jgi:XrtN system VIT domain protein
VVLHQADIALVKEQGQARSNGPDHLMRLFAYNHIMQQAGQAGFARFPDSSALVQTAKEAYVVSPVSSLVVLESEKDYERFDISDSEASLKNASAKSKGAVPEPHEWVLIFIGVAVALYLFFKSKL